MDKTVVIMAAGMGSRYGGLKQLDQMGPSGETIIEYSVFDAMRAGFNKIVFVIREDFAEVFREKIGARFEGRIRTEYVFQNLEDIPEGFLIPEGRTKPWGTGHAMLSASEVTEEPFIIINADDFYGADAFLRAAGFLDGIGEGQMSAALVGFYLKNTLSANGTVSRGICGTDSDNIMTDVVEVHGIHKDQVGNYVSDTGDDLRSDTVVSMNMWAFSPSVFSYAREYFRRFLKDHGGELKSEFYIPLIVNTLIKEEGLRVEVLNTASEWYGVTYREDKDELVEVLAGYTDEGVYPKKLWS